MKKSIIYTKNDVRIETSKNNSLDAYYRLDESGAMQAFFDYIQLSPAAQRAITHKASQLVEQLRLDKQKQGGLDAFLATFDLSTDEGIVLMCIAEAMLRIPDKTTIDSLIRDKITQADWKEHLGSSDSVFVNIATWALMLTGKIVDETDKNKHKFTRTIKKVTKRAGEPIIRKAVGQAMKILGQQFVMGESIVAALAHSKDDSKKGYSHSYDMLGEAARTESDALRYMQSYHDAIVAIGQASVGKDSIESPGISIKLSALYPRYETSHQATAIAVLSERLLKLACLARDNDIGLTVDAEEADRLAMSIEIIENVFMSPELADWEGFGLAIQAYQKRCFYLIDVLQKLSQRANKTLMIRLVKGAYWDTEIKLAQVQGLSDYPVFTRKENTDVSYIACAKKLLAYEENFYCQFATHNPHTLATILQFTDKNSSFEFQCLHGMGQALYDSIMKNNQGIKCRIYAPVGNHKDLLPYLVRRLLENGANTSFVNRVMDKSLSIEDIVADPINKALSRKVRRHSKIPLPENLYGKQRQNSLGIDLTNHQDCLNLQRALMAASKKKFSADRSIKAKIGKVASEAVYDPCYPGTVVGQVTKATIDDVDAALIQAQSARFSWQQMGAKKRAAILDKIADLMHEDREKLIYLAVREAGKTIADAVAEVREAIDFCRYYAAQARNKLAKVTTLVGPTGEDNTLAYYPRGIFVCISPWNFPLAIFTGQIVAALVAGNCVLAKPAEQTPLIAAMAVDLFYQAGIPKEVLHFLPGKGRTIGSKMIGDKRIDGVIFTGSTAVAKNIQNTLAEQSESIKPLIAETGGQNVMIVDSSALPEQVVDDVINSAFGSAGQRCSALRVLFLQDDIADGVLGMLKGAMAELTVGDPGLLSTDLGPVIYQGAQEGIQQHINRLTKEGSLFYQTPIETIGLEGHFIAPTAFIIDSLSQLEEEVFGPVLHIIRFKLDDLDQVIDDINQTGYGLTLGIHSRVEERIDYLHQRLRVGNTYVNRDTIGAVVGVQPFGGEGKSGTGPKAGGPDYLPKLCVERTLTVNTTATGGNASLLTLSDE